jgi:hypothetical protein
VTYDRHSGVQGARVSTTGIPLRACGKADFQLVPSPRHNCHHQNSGLPEKCLCVALPILILM